MYGIKTAVARDAEFLLSNMAAPIGVGDYFACDVFVFRLVCRRLRLLAFVNIANDSFTVKLSVCTAQCAASYRHRISAAALTNMSITHQAQIS